MNVGDILLTIKNKKMNEIKGFIKSEKVAEILNSGFESGMNAVLFGRGGFGKSEMAYSFLEQKGVDASDIMVKSLSVGTMLDDLLGGLNIKTIQKTGFQEFNVNLSIFSKPYLILEEAFDAPVRVLEGLKDIITSKQIRNGLQTYDIKTKFIIICTNRPKDQIAKDDSSKALMERFPLSLEVGWDNPRYMDYKKLITVKGKKPSDDYLSLIKFVIESISETEDLPPSPRMALNLSKIVDTCGIHSARYLDGMPNIEHAVNWVAENQEKLNRQKEQEQKQAKIKQAIGELVVAFLESVDKITDDTPVSEYRALVSLKTKLMEKTSNNNMEDEFKVLKATKL